MTAAETPAGAAQHLAVDQPIINNPFREPTQHWVYQDGQPYRAPGRREPGYYFRQRRAIGAQVAMFQEEVFNPLPRVKAIRDAVRAWRERGYPGVSPITRQLLDHWSHPDRERRLFFCQREAAETVIWLLETDAGRAARGGLPLDGALRRLACKMATGSGKTVVMAMLIAWSVLNRVHAPRRRIFSDAVLVVCPNLTVKERLGGAPRGETADEPERPLIPGARGNYYERFDLVPTSLRAALGQGRVLIKNWHAFLPQDDGRRRGVVQRGAESDAAFCARVLRDLGGARDLLVLNDEAHHAYRPGVLPDETAGLSAEARKEALDANAEATVWIDGLDRIARVRGINACVDLSATPFYIEGGGHGESEPFDWLVSDFGLVDAIESGIVKVPRVPVADSTGRPEPEFFRLWEHLTTRKLEPHERGSARRKPSPEAIVREADPALQQLAGLWTRTFEEMRQAGYAVPPCLIVVADNTSISELLYEKIALQGGVQADYLANVDGREVALRIDTKLLNQAESETEAAGSREQRAQALRQKVATVGRASEPGAMIRCVISVAMLTEGWDAPNVTHILGLRAFQSQLLCEQVVGRGLRRLNYDFELNADGIPTLVEYVDVYGIPFEVIPVKKTSPRQPPPPPVESTWVQALPEREAAFRIEFPRVEGYVYRVEDRVVADLSTVERVRLSQDVAPTETIARAKVGVEVGRPALTGPGETVVQTRQQFYESTRLQQVEYELARRLVETLAETAEFRFRARHLLFPQVLRLVRAFLAERVDRGSVDPREIGLETYMQLVVGRLAAAIKPAGSEGQPTILPRLERFRPRGSTSEVSFRTTRPCRETLKSHLSHVVLDTETWEASVALQLETSPHVVAYARNDHLELAIPYDFLGRQHRYYPDFVVRLTNGTTLLLEVKGQEDEQDRQKAQAAKRWCDAVNAWGQMGLWRYALVRRREDVPGVLTPGT